jgi:hypothetical protein
MPQGVSPLQAGLPVGFGVPGVALVVRGLAGGYQTLNLEGLESIFIPGEYLQVVDKLDSRNASAECTVNDEAGTGGEVGDIVSKKIDIPAGEIWIISDFGVTGTAEPTTGRAKYNIPVSIFPKIDGNDKPYLPEDRSVPNATTEIIDIYEGKIGETYIGELGCFLRIVGPASITLKVTVATAFAVDETQDVTLVLYGRKVHRVVS